VTELVERATGWVREVHPHARHLTRTLDWLVELDPGAGEALRIAAVTHDSERAFPDPDCPWDSANDFDAPGYLRYHQERCAAITDAWLAEQDAPEPLRREVAALVAVHEQGGWREADLLQAADSLSFLEVMVPLVEGWIVSGRAPAGRAVAKLQEMHDRVSPGLPRAGQLAEPLLAAGLERLRTIAPPDGSQP
jgi:hypothetical protein